MMKKTMWLCVLAVCVLGLSACKSTDAGGGSGGTASSMGQLKEKELPKKEAIDEFNKAKVAFERGDISGAKSKLESAISSDKRFSKAYFNLGVLNETEGNKKEAQKFYQQAADASDRFAAPHVALGYLAMEKGDKDAAWEHFQKAVAEDKFNPEANNNIAVMLRMRKEYKEAIRFARRSLAGDAEDTGTYANLAMIYYDMGLNDVAKLVVENALQISEKDADVWNTYGLIELKNKNVTLAIKMFDKALKLNPDFVPGLMNMGAIQLSVRNYPRAIELFEKALKLKKNDVEARISIAVAKRGMGNLKEAERVYSEVLKEDANNPLALFNMGVLHHEHLAQAAISGEGDAPSDPVKQMEWTTKNMEKAVTHYEKGREFYAKFLDTYEGDREEWSTDARKRVDGIAKLISTMREQIDQLEEQTEELRSMMQQQAAQQKAAAAAAKKAAAAKAAPAPANSKKAEGEEEKGKE